MMAGRKAPLLLMYEISAVRCSVCSYERIKLLKSLTMKSLAALLGKLTDSETAFDFFQGFFTALLCSPSPIKQERLLAVIVHEEEILRFDCEKQHHELDTFIGLLMETLHQNLLKGRYKPYFKQRIDNPVPADAKRWAMGMLKGIALWEPSYLKNQDTVQMILPIMLLGEMNQVRNMLTAESMKEIETDENAVMQMMLDGVDECVVELFRYVQKMPTRADNILRKNRGRNDLCSCGSGKKYKHCCGKP